jgi:hypothetical protein
VETVGAALRNASGGGVGGGVTMTMPLLVGARRQLLLSVLGNRHASDQLFAAALEACVKAMHESSSLRY